MGTFHQFIFLCFAFFGFAANRLWFRLKHQSWIHGDLPRHPIELPPPSSSGQLCRVPHSGSDTFTPKQEIIARLLLLISVLGALLFALGLYLTGYLIPFQMPRWLLILVSSPLLVTVPLGTLAGVLASITMRDLDSKKPSLIYGMATALIFFAGLLYDDFGTLVKRIGAIESQYLSINFVSPIPEASPLVIGSSANDQSSAAFEGDTSFSTGVNSLHRLADAFGRDQDFARRCITGHSSAVSKGKCPELIRVAEPAAVNREIPSLLLLPTDPMSGFLPLFQCMTWYAEIYPNGLPIQEDLYNLSAPLARSFGAGMGTASATANWPDDVLIEDLKSFILDFQSGIDLDLLARAKEEQWWTDRELAYLIRANIPFIDGEKASLAEHRDKIVELLEWRDEERILRTQYLDNIIRELRSEASRVNLATKTGGTGPSACLSLSESQILQSWDALPRGPHKVIMAAYIIAASGYPEEAAVLVSRYLDVFADDESIRAEEIVVQEILRLRMLSVLNVLLQYIGDYGLLTQYLFRIVQSHERLLSQWYPGFGIADSPGMQKACQDPDLQRYVRSFLSAENRLLYFAGKHGVEAFGGKKEVVVHLHAAAQYLFNYASSPLIIDAFNLNSSQIVACFVKEDGNLEEEAYRVFKRDALLAFAYANIALGAHYLAGEQIVMSDMDRYLRAAKLALLDARDITRQLLDEEQRKSAERHELDPLRRERLTSAERRNEREIEMLLTKLRGS